MSVIIKTSEMQYKDNNGVYHGVNAIAEKKIADQVAALDAAIDAQETRIATDISQMQSAADEIESQRQTMIASIASVAGQGTDTTLTQEGVAADAKASGDKISEIKNAFGTTLTQITLASTLKKGYYFKVSNGASASSNKYARTESLVTGYGSIIAVVLSNNDYEYNVGYYDSTGATDGTGYIDCTNYGKGLYYIPKNAIKIGISFRREDQVALSDEDITAINAALFIYASTDTTLSLNGIAADASTTGKGFINTDTLAKNLLVDLQQNFSSATFTLGRYRNLKTGELASANSAPSYAISGSYAKSKRMAVLFTNSSYQFSVVTFSATPVEFANFIAGYGWYDAGKIINLPTDIAAFCVQVRKVDGTAIADSELTAIRAGFKFLTATDATLTQENKAADGKAVGDSIKLIAESQEVDKTTGTTINYYIGISQGQVLSSSRTVRTIYFTCKPNTTYKIEHVFGMQFVVACFTSAPAVDDYATKWYNGRNENVTIFKTDSTAKYLAIYYYSDATTTATEQECYDALVISSVGLDEVIKDVNELTSGKAQRGAYNGFFSSVDDIAVVTTFESVIALYDELVELYPEFVTKNTLTSGSFTNYEYVFTLGNYNGKNGERDANLAIPKPVVLLVSGIHGYERSAVISLYTVMRSICENNYNLLDIINAATFKVIPVGCPYSFTNNSRVNANGVNINRNFATTSWHIIGEPGNTDYSGAEAGDQDETKVIQNWIVANNNARIYIDYHNSNYVSEIAEMSGGHTGESLNFKKKWLMGLNKIIPYWRKQRGIDNTNNYYCYTGGTGDVYQSSRGYAMEIGGIELAFSHETSWNVIGSGKHSNYSIGVGAEAIGNGLIAIKDFLSII